jgi:chemotaxis protein methyltransferase CheR
VTSADTALALSTAAGIDLGRYRPEHVGERIRRAIDREGVTDVGALAERLRRSAAARTRFRLSVAVSVSGLFRDPAQFDLLEQSLLPPLLEGGRPLRVWSAGCADGSELYSLGILLERLGALDRAFLLGSDLLEENLETARAGTYGDVAIEPSLRARTRWERRDLTCDGAPRGLWQLVLCRNVAIYLAPAARSELHRLLAESLTVGGILLLGRSERLAAPSALGLERAAPHAYRRLA